MAQKSDGVFWVWEAAGGRRRVQTTSTGCVAAVAVMTGASSARVSAAVSGVAE